MQGRLFIVRLLVRKNTNNGVKKHTLFILSVQNFCIIYFCSQARSQFASGK